MKMAENFREFTGGSFSGQNNNTTGNGGRKNGKEKKA